MVVKACQREKEKKNVGWRWVNEMIKKEVNLVRAGWEKNRKIKALSSQLPNHQRPGYTCTFSQSSSLFC